MTFDHLQLSGPIPSLDSIAIPINSPVPDGPPDIIPGLLPMRGGLVIAGATNQGKTLISLEMCSALIHGTPLWGELSPVRTIKRVLYILGEHNTDVLQRLALKTQLPMSAGVLLLGPEQLKWDKWLVTGGKINVVAFEKFSVWAQGADLIIWDPLSAFLSGQDAENDNVQMRLVLQTMNDIAYSVGAACIILAHQGKPQMDQFGKEHSRKSYAIRGASAIEDAATNIFYLDRANGESEAAAKATGGQIFSLINRKYKGEAPPDYRLLRDPSTLTHTLLGNRPFVEVQRIATQSALGKMQASFPDKKVGELIKILAVVKDVSEQTIRRHLGVA